MTEETAKELIIAIRELNAALMRLPHPNQYNPYQYPNWIPNHIPQPYFYPNRQTTCGQ